MGKAGLALVRQILFPFLHPELPKKALSEILNVANFSITIGRSFMVMTSDEITGIHEKIKNGSLKERAEFWQGVPKDEAMSRWETELNNLLKPYKTDPSKKEELLFLQKILRQSDQQPLDSVEVSARTIYNIFFHEAKGDVEFFVERIIENNTIEEIAHNRQLIGKLAKIYGAHSASVALGLLSDYKNTIELQTPYSIIGTDLNENIDVAISLKARQQCLTIIGANGTGKSALISRLIHQDIRNNLGLALLDPHGDLTRTVISSMPDDRLKDVIYLNLEDVDYPFGLNLFECPRLTIADMAKTASFVYHVFQKIWQLDNASSPRLLGVLRALTLTLIENPGNTLSEAPLLLSSHTIRAKMIENLTNQKIILFWENYNRRSQRDRFELTASTGNKISALLDKLMIRNIVSQSKTTIDFRNIMDSGKILLVQVSPQFEQASTLIGSILIGKLLLSAMSRTDTPEENRRQFNLYIDEVQRFQTPDLATLISEARKYRISTSSANQVLAQLSEENRASLLAAGNLIVFRVSGEDGKTLAPSFDSTPQQVVIGYESERSFVSDVMTHLVKRGHNDPRVVRFAQVYLKNLEDLVHKITQYDYWPVYGEWPIDLKIETRFIRQASQLLNESIYRCMVEKTASRQLSPLALYILSVAQHDRSETVFFPYINYYGILSPYYFQGFFKGKGVEMFGDPSFINKESDCFIESCRKKKKPAAIALVNMITELRYTMDPLAKQPILLDTGQLIPKFSNRTYSDQQAEVANSLTNQPNYQAKVKLLTGEYTIQTIKPTGGIEDSQKETRIRQIQQQTRQNYCKPRTEIEQEIRERQDRLKAVENKPNPTSTKATQPQRTRRRRADETPPAWS